MTKEMVASAGAFYSDQHVPTHVRALCLWVAGDCSRCHSDALDSDKLQICGFLPLNFKAKFNGFANFQHQFIERRSICVASGEARDRCHVHTVFISFDHNIKLALHTLQFSAATAQRAAGKQAR